MLVLQYKSHLHSFLVHQMVFKNLFTITENQSDIQPHKRLSSNLWMHDPDHEEGRKNDKTTKMRRKTTRTQSGNTPWNAIRNPFCTEPVCVDPIALPSKVVLSLAQAKLRCKHTNH